MDPDGMWKLIALIALLFLSAFFSASETALTSISKTRVMHLQNEGIKGADQVYRLKEKPNKLLGTILVGNNIVNVGASSLATAIAIDLFKNKGIAVATLIMTILILIFGEITPKSLATEYSDKISLKVARPLSLLVKILNPLVIAFTFLATGLIKLFGGKSDYKRPFMTEEELKTIVNVSQEEGVLEAEEKEMIYNVFQFGDLQIKDVMLPRTDIIALNLNTNYDEFFEVMKEQQFSRYPVYNDKIDNIVGVLNVKDMFLSTIDKDNFQIEELLREAYYIFESKKIIDAFNDMKKKRIHMAIVLDEYGGTAGIVTIEDLIEEIVGDIDDEYDDHGNGIELINDKEFLIDGSAKIDDVNETIGTSFESENFDSIGGLIIGELGRLPLQGDEVDYNGIKLIVEKVGKNRISTVRVLI